MYKDQAEHCGKSMARLSEFLGREDNSVIQPGKWDTNTVDKQVKQKHVLNDYMHKLWEKFLLEYPT